MRNTAVLLNIILRISDVSIAIVPIKTGCPLAYRSLTSSTIALYFAFLDKKIRSGLSNQSLPDWLEY